MTPAGGGSTERSAADPAEQSRSGADHPETAESAERSEPSAGSTVTAADGRTLGRRGWLLVAAVVVAFIGVPLVILFRPPSLPFLFAYLALPLLPAFLLAALAVWVALPRDED